MRGAAPLTQIPFLEAEDEILLPLRQNVRGRDQGMGRWHFINAVEIIRSLVFVHSTKTTNNAMLQLTCEVQPEELQ